MFGLGKCGHPVGWEHVVPGHCLGTGQRCFSKQIQSRHIPGGNMKNHHFPNLYEVLGLAAPEKHCTALHWRVGPASQLKTTSRSTCGVSGARPWEVTGSREGLGWPGRGQPMASPPQEEGLAQPRAGLRDVQRRSKACHCLAPAVREEAHPSLFTLIKLLTGFWQIGKKSVCSS